MVLLVAEELWLSHSEVWAEEYQQAYMFLLVAQLDSAFELSFSSSIAFSELHLVVNKKYNNISYWGT